MNEQDKRAHINALQSLQRDINFLSKSAENNPSLEATIDILRNSQDKLYAALAQHGITAEEVHKVIIENSDRVIIKEIMRLQGVKDIINNQLAQPNLTPEQTESLEAALADATKQHAAKWDEVINSPDKDRIIDKIEQAQIKQLEKEQARDRRHDRTREPDRSR